MHVLIAENPMLHECSACASSPVGYHRCAFLGGSFDHANWNCRSFAKLVGGSTVHTDEIEIHSKQSTNGAVLIWLTRVGTAQRVRQVMAFGPDLTPLPVTRALVESFYTNYHPAKGESTREA